MIGPALTSLATKGLIRFTVFKQNTLHKNTFARILSTATCIILDWCHLCFWSCSQRWWFHGDLHSPCRFALKSSPCAHLLEWLLDSTTRLQFPIIYSFRYFSFLRIPIQFTNYFGLPRWLNHPFYNIREKTSNGLKPYENVHWFKLTKGIKPD